MKVRTSVTLSEDIVAALEERAERGEDRSELIEVALRRFLTPTSRAEDGARDLEIIERRADDLNREAEDVLEYQILP
ncbi:MAG TPA: ribbon-helix-helix protein, CopG family [Thermoanaerobaculia bacterium]|nr:ribbon-helix-helix protein, CopG family [Thermoanaerobaculia bacterium]